MADGEPCYSVKDLERAIKQELKGLDRRSVVNLLVSQAKKREAMAAPVDGYEVVPEVLPPAKPGPGAIALIDSEDMRAAATAALCFHHAAAQGATLAVINAVACGVQLAKAKAALPHGQFEAWRKKYIPDVSERSSRMYLQTVTRMEELGGGYKQAVKLLDTGGQQITTEHAKKLGPKVREIFDGGSLTDLYRELGVVKPKQTKGEKAAKKIGPSTGNPAADNARIANVWAGEILELLGYADVHREFITDDTLNALFDGFRKASADLGVPFK